MKISVCAASVAALFLIHPTANAQDVTAGRVLFSTGDVQRVSPTGQATPVAKGEIVRKGDVLRTGAGGHVQIAMADKGLLALRPDSAVRVKDFHFEGKSDGKERLGLELLQGGLRSITGAIGSVNKANYKLEAETATIGIRGTDHETFLVRQPGDASPAGTYNRVTVGGTYIQAPQGRVDLDPGQVGFAPLGGANPVKLDRTPDFMHVAALQQGGTDNGPAMRSAASSDERRLQDNIGGLSLGQQVQDKAVRPVTPAQALQENSPGRGFGRGGRCDGPCGGPPEGKGKPDGVGKPFSGAGAGAGGLGNGNGKGGGVLSSGIHGKANGGGGNGNAGGNGSARGNGNGPNRS
jgi:hypothetical protein